MDSSARGITAAVVMFSLLACQGTPIEPPPGEEGPPQPPPAGQTPDAGAPPASRWIPPPGTSWQIQFTGTLDTSVNVQAFDLDLFDTPASTIRALQGRGVKVICYFSAGSHEDWRPDSGQFPPETLGNPLDGWPGERWLDIRSPAVVEIMKRRMDLAVQKKCDALELDNVDGYTNRSGFNLTAADQLRYNRRMAEEAHARGLSIGLKNDLEQVQGLVDHFDFAINESCFEYDECELLLPFIRARKAVFHIEYTGWSSEICRRANSLDFDTLFKNLSLDARRTPCR